MKRIEDVIIKWRLLLCGVFAIVLTALYGNGLIADVKMNLSNIGLLLSSLLVVVTLILTLLLYLNDKEKYKEAIARFGTKKGKNMIFAYLYKILLSNIICIIITILIGVLKIDMLVFRLMVTAVAAYVFGYLFIGTIYMLWFAIDIAGNINARDDKTIE